MTKAVQRRRGTNAEHSSFTGLEGELSVNTTNDSVHVHDGSTAGGFELARADGSNVDNFAVGGDLDVTGNVTIGGNITIGDADTDSININADLTSSLIPNADDTYDLGTATKQWRNLYIDGTAEIDSLSIDGTAITATAAELNVLDGITATVTELNYTDGVTSAIQTQLDAKADLAGDTFTGNIGFDSAATVSLDVGDRTDAIHVPSGTTAQRPTGANGYLRYNSDDGNFEGYANGAWGSIAGGANITIDTMTGDGVDTTLTLSVAPDTENNTSVYIDGVYQNKTTYSVSGTTLTFTTAPPSGSLVEASVVSTATLDTPADGSVTPAKIASGDFYFDTDTLYVDATNNRVGIGTGSPTAKLHVAGGGILGSSSTNPIAFTGSGSTNAGIGSYNANTDMNIYSAGTGDIKFRTGATWDSSASLTSTGTERMRIDGSGIVTISSGYIGEGDTMLLFASSVDAIVPRGTGGAGRDAAIDLGNVTNRWDDIYAANGTIQTSDEREKQDIEELSQAEQNVAVAAKSLLRKYRWKDSVAEKGDAARIHFGIIAQDLKAAFEAEGLDAGRYAMFINSEWWETYTDVPAVEAQDAVLDEDGNVVTKAVEAKEAYTRTDTYYTEEEAPEGAVKKDRMGIRYSELLAFIIAAI